MNRRRALRDRALVALVAIVAWQLAALTWGAQWVSPPISTARRLVELVLGGDLARHAAFTLLAAAGGCLLGGVPGTVLPLSLRRAPRVTAILDPYLVAGYGMPKLALAPLFILWFGIGLASKVVLVASLVFFLVLFSTAAGVRAVDGRLVAMARVVGASEHSIARLVVWPGAVPYVFAGFKISLPYAIGAAVVGEMISSSRGLGYLIAAASQDFDSATVFATLAALALLVVAAAHLIEVVERRLLRWRPARPMESLVTTA